MNIFLRELKASRKSLIIWIVIVAMFTVMGFSKAGAYYENPEMLAILDSMPPAVLAAFSMEAFNLTTVTGFFGIMIMYFAIVLGIAAAMWGSSVISKEERDKTVEFSLSLPVTRRRLVTAKSLAMLANCIILLLVQAGAIWVSVAKYEIEDGFPAFFGFSMLALFLLQLIFLSLGIFLGCALKKHKLSGSLSIWILLGAYFLSILIGLEQDLDFLKYLTPFRYFQPIQILRDSALEPGFVLLSVGIIVACMAGAFITYRRRDLYI